MDKRISGNLINRIRENKPLIHNITNIVVANFTANGLLALGAKPVMASAPEEVAEMTKAANALVLNMGTLNREHLKAMIISGKAANEKGIPVVLDPVGVGATQFRTESAQQLLREVNANFIRGNAAEIANLIGQAWEIRGVEAGKSDGNVVDLAILAAQKLQATVVITGKKDIITDGATTFLVCNGHPLLTKVTGAGCLLSAVIGAFAAEESDLLQAAISALTTYGIAAEIAAAKTAGFGPGSFQVEFINQLALISPTQIEQYSQFESL
ncbi:hydroxyethylthiazole kinase [Schinkia azotoformans]|uniref:hydroxyethylthiazole kinase n=1 Tax=Schinkia azotoformans TaxID=1454 RepID=UPI002DBE55B9|nr:hydroxyethylthiazole kinase [Schinkia azotoformans]MEC1717174.1 hydroxyethylthiazole kinase [Schinkia azotoformans]MEC1741988.1 hydroxyethylthiazole kinase [Schinkia azotoformans]MEC1758229.1 hydroxyethylthiazole kinase [Schinkia azotoformans]MEC1766370.1 hydroxyethylthiazole kinase [Schinkia azotoformans]MEC1786450.1 hydroxyethylthiazole kinase [Schinkia azotoformans]